MRHHNYGNRQRNAHWLGCCWSELCGAVAPLYFGCARYICCCWWCAISSPNREFRIEVDQVFHWSFDYAGAFDVVYPDMPPASSKARIFYIFSILVSEPCLQKKKKRNRSRWNTWHSSNLVSLFIWIIYFAMWLSIDKFLIFSWWRVKLMMTNCLIP